MRKQDHLIKLISTLSPAEKRYFKQFNSIQPGEKRYMGLFDALENERQYEAGPLMKKLNLNSKQLRDDKYYLTQSLLKCLRNYEQVDINLPVQRMVEIARSEMSILMGRGLWDFALELAEKNLKITLECEAFDMAASLMLVKGVCLFNLARVDELDGKFFDERNRIANILDQNRELFRLQCIITKAEKTRKTGPHLDKIMQHKLVTGKPEKLLSLQGQVSWFDIVFRYYVINGIHNKSLEIAQRQWKLYDKHKTVRRLNPIIWIKSYADLAACQLEAGHPANALDVLRQMEQLLDGAQKVLSQGATRAWKEYMHSLTMLSLFELKRFKEVIKGEETTDISLSGRPGSEQFLRMYVHGFSLMNDNKSELAIIKLNELLQLNSDERKDMQPYIRTAIILCQLKLGNFQMVPYLIKSSKAWMKRQKYALPEIELFFSFAYSIAKATALQRTERWTKLRDAVKANKLNTLNEKMHLSLLV